MSIATRLTFWGVICTTGVVVASFVRVVTVSLIKYHGRKPHLLLESGCFALISVPIFVGLTREMATNTQFQLPPIEQAFVYTMLFHLFGVAIRKMSRPEDKIHAPAMTPMVQSKPTPPRLLDRIQGHNNAEIVHLTVDDHYVEILLSNGLRHRLLMRFRDAVAEMDGVPGHMVHRSHWVSHAAIRSVERDNGREFVLLNTGGKVPVGRTYRDTLVRVNLLAPRD
ncbi:LytTR family DNA-binding domain-containing protein [Aestuariibius sp. HNIBRBA575]|uniref:LytTR family DNA-binding domain-containing protein n=1 Tax=Aestuariibius sp. HNIBRBA575 TaxID=3233343 RepID=UPI0034A16746